MFDQESHYSKEFANSIIELSVIHVDAGNWRYFVNSFQIPSLLIQNLDGINVNYFCSRRNFFYSMINKVIEHMRWRSSRYASYAISYLLKFIFFPMKNYVPRYRFLEFNRAGFRIFRVNFPELTATMRWKRLAILQHFIEDCKADILIMITSTSIVNFTAIRNSLRDFENKAKSPFVAGPFLQSADGEFISGSFIVCNRSAAELILRHSRELPVHSMDDVALGVALTNLKIEKFNLKSVSLYDQEQVNKMTDYELTENCHFRSSTPNFEDYMTSLSQRLFPKL